MFGFQVAIDIHSSRLTGLNYLLAEKSIKVHPFQRLHFFSNFLLFLKNYFVYLLCVELTASIQILPGN